MPQEMRPLDAVVAGYLGVDLAPEFPRDADAQPLSRLLRPGRLVEVGPMTISLGGAVANTGLAMSILGKRVALVGLVGEDALGDVALGLLGAHEAELHVERCAAAGTAYGIVIAPPGTDRVFLEYPGCNRHFRADHVSDDLLRRCRLLHFGYPPLMPQLLENQGAELAGLFSRARSLGIVTSLDMTLPDPDGPAGQADWPAILARILPRVDIFTPSVEELLCMLEPAQYAAVTAAAGDDDPVAHIPDAVYPRLTEAALQLGARVVLLKAGSRGGYLRAGDADRLAALGVPVADWTGRELWLPPCPVDPARVCNASGAGDAAVAGFLCALLDAAAPEEAGSRAMEAGRDNLYGPDALSGLQSRQHR